MEKTILMGLLCAFVFNTYICAQSSEKDTTYYTDQFNNEQKKYLTPKDYKLWESIKSLGLSDNGDWYTYYKFNNKSALFLASTKSDSKYSFPFGMSFEFNVGSKWFACLTQEKGLGLIYLETGNIQWISDVSSFEFTSDGKYLLCKQNVQNGASAKTNLLIRNLKTGKVATVADVEDYVISPNSKQLAYTQNIENKKAVKLLDIGQKIPITITQNNVNSYKHLIWNTEGTALGFLEVQPSIESKNTYKIYCYATIKGKETLSCLDPAADSSVLPGRNIVYEHFKLKFAVQGTLLYFKVRGTKDLPKPVNNNRGADVEVWKAEDIELYPIRKGNQYSKTYGARLASWYPGTGKTTVLETKTLPKAIVSNNGRFMLSYDPLVYEPSFAVKGNNDIYLTDLKTGMSHLLLKKYGGRAFISPNSRYINYFRDKHWWVYDIKKQSHTNITKDIPVNWYKDVPKHPHKNGLKPHGAPGWIEEDKALIVYDKYDVWLISPEGKGERITQGRNSKICHRIYSKDALYQGQTKSHINAVFIGGVYNVIRIAQGINISKGLVFKTEGTDKASGYSIWTPKEEPKVLVYKSMRVTELMKSKKKDVYTCVEESFNVSPRIMCLNKGHGSSILAESNSQQKQYHWGYPELISYKGPDGEDLYGALFYPANYKSGKKYPMIVEVYEQLSNALHSYQNPTEYNQNRLNPTNYTTAGYFFFYPDISYTLNDVGMSALRCVEAAVKAVIKKGIVEEEHIGLTGHSFGGYETNFIITQSNLFAAAVSGAGVSDVVSHYHGGDMKNYEDWQYCFKGGFYENTEAYLRNSPVQHLANVNTPLLLWAGKNDGSVDYRQSFEMYYGLRRLNKTCELLYYPNEGHHIKKAKNQIYQTRRIKAWFDKYLKPEK